MPTTVPKSDERRGGAGRSQKAQPPSGLTRARGQDPLPCRCDSQADRRAGALRRISSIRAWRQRRSIPCRRIALGQGLVQFFQRLPDRSLSKRLRLRCTWPKRHDLSKMIAHVQTEARSRPIMTSLTTQPACQKSAQIESCPGTSASVSIPESCLPVDAIKFLRRKFPFRFRTQSDLPPGSMRLRPHPARIRFATTGFSGQILVKGRRGAVSAFSRYPFPAGTWLRHG